MKKLVLLICMCLVIVLFCCSCGLFGDQRYNCDVDEVTSAQIIRLDKYVQGEYRYEYTVLAQISDYATFVNRLDKLKHSVNWGDPGQMKEQYTVIKIDYRNGDFDLIYPNAQWFNRSGKNQNGYFFFDKEQFDALVSDYLSE